MDDKGGAALERLTVELEAEFPSFRILDKVSSPFQKLVHWGLVVVTAGQMRDYLTGYHTTMGSRLYVAPRWAKFSAAERYVLLCHERVHLRQFRRYTRVGMSLLYLLVPLPLGLAFFRARFEKEAYAETLRATAEMYGIEQAEAPALRAHILRQFIGPSYGWMWPFRSGMERWYDRQLARLRADYGVEEKDGWE